MFLMGFDFDITYRNTKEHGNADFFSRLPTKSEELANMQTTNEEMYILDQEETFLLNQMEVLPINSNDIAMETDCDEEFKELLQAMKGKRKTENKYFRIPSTEFSISNGCLTRGHRIMIPKVLRSKILTELHEGHFGTTNMKNVARSHVWWPGISSEIEAITKSCLSCLSNARAPNKAPVHQWHKPLVPFYRIHIDFCGPLMGKKFLVVMDAHSKWPEIFISDNPNSQSTIKILSEIFGRFGLPCEVVSDNDPIFKSVEFETFLKTNAIKHKLSPPFHPATNGQAERTVQTLKDHIKKMSFCGGDIYSNLQRLLLQWRANIVSTSTGKTPAEVLFNYPLRTKMSMLHEHSNETQNPHVNRDTKFQLGEIVSVRNYSKYGEKWIKGIISKKFGPRNYLVEVDDNLWKRHQEQLRKRSQDIICNDQMFEYDLSVDDKDNTHNGSVNNNDTDNSIPNLSQSANIPSNVRTSGRSTKGIPPVKLNL
jgi:hypothetical protein